MEPAVYQTYFLLKFIHKKFKTFFLLNRMFHLFEKILKLIVKHNVPFIILIRFRLKKNPIYYLLNRMFHLLKLSD